MLSAIRPDSSMAISGFYQLFQNPAKFSVKYRTAQQGSGKSIHEVKVILVKVNRKTLGV